MAKRNVHIAWVIVFLVMSRSGAAQSVAVPKATIDRNKILIGEPIQLLLDVRAPAGSKTVWFPLDSMAHFDFLQKGKIDTASLDAEQSYRQLLTITSFDSGSQVIPPLLLVINDKKYYTDSIRVEVGFTPFDPKQDYHDIKDIIAVENPFAKYIVWIVSGITLLSLVMVIFLIRMRQKARHVLPELVSKLSPYDEAVQALKELRQQQLPDKGQLKLYYTRLNDILRLFMLRKLHLSSMEKTNEELILQLRQLNISPGQFSQLAEALRMSDFVKFAKYLPGPMDNDKNFAVIESSVHLLNEMEP